MHFNFTNFILLRNIIQRNKIIKSNNHMTFFKYYLFMWQHENNISNINDFEIANGIFIYNAKIKHHNYIYVTFLDEKGKLHPEFIQNLMKMYNLYGIK